MLFVDPEAEEDMDETDIQAVDRPVVKIVNEGPKKEHLNIVFIGHVGKWTF